MGLLMPNGTRRMVNAVQPGQAPGIGNRNALEPISTFQDVKILSKVIPVGRSRIDNLPFLTLRVLVSSDEGSFNNIRLYGDKNYALGMELTPGMYISCICGPIIMRPNSSNINGTFANLKEFIPNTEACPPFVEEEIIEQITPSGGRRYVTASNANMNFNTGIQPGDEEGPTRQPNGLQGAGFQPRAPFNPAQSQKRTSVPTELLAKQDLPADTVRSEDHHTGA